MILTAQSLAAGKLRKQRVSMTPDAAGLIVQMGEGPTAVRAIVGWDELRKSMPAFMAEIAPRLNKRLEPGTAGKVRS